jgi:HEAT repeat protein
MDPVELSERRRNAVLAGYRNDESGARRAIADPHPSVRSLGYGALHRLGRLTETDVCGGLRDPDSVVARRVVSALGSGAAGAAPLRTDTVFVELTTLLTSGGDETAEAAAWALGEWFAPVNSEDEVGEATPYQASLIDRAIATLSAACVGHGDALVREAAAAALGSIGNEAGLPAILTACGDKATVRRRAVLALAPFHGPDVTAALTRARSDRDWQVRQAAEDLLNAAQT